MQTYWFFDSAIKRSTDGAKVIPGTLRKDSRNPLFPEGVHETPALPWELQIGNGYPNVFYDPLIRKYRCYYTSYLPAEENGCAPESKQVYKSKENKITGILYAESSDGNRWEKPALGVTEYQHSTANNIIALHTHGAGVLFDPGDPDPRKRYKIISRDDRGPLNIHAAFSEDGIRFYDWTAVIDDPLYPGDTHNFVIRDPESGKYLLYTRSFMREMRTEVRLVSDDFIHWTDGQTVLYGADADEQIYGMPVFRMDGLYWGLAEIFYAGDSSLMHFDHVEVELCYSGDGLRWQRITPGNPFLKNGAAGQYDFGCCYASPPIDDGVQLRFYYMGGSGTHYNLKETGLCLARIDKNRLAGVTARHGDEFIYQTRKMILDPASIKLCLDIENGEVCCELLDENGFAIQGYTREESIPVTSSGDQISLKWADAKSFTGPCMLKFYCKNAVLYSMTGNIILQPSHPL